jgi:hypothetical protein
LSGVVGQASMPAGVEDVPGRSATRESPAAQAAPGPESGH